MQDTCGVTHPAGVHRHLDDLLFDRRRLTWIAIVQQESTTSTAVLAAPVPLLALPGVAMADDVDPVAVRTVQDLENPDATRSRWGSRFQRHSASIAHQHLCDIFAVRMSVPLLHPAASSSGDAPYTATLLVLRWAGASQEQRRLRIRYGRRLPTPCHLLRSRTIGVRAVASSL